MASDEVCTPKHDWFTAMLTLCLCLGLVVSYLPQHLRIIRNGTSEGLSAWFLLLGSTSSAAGFLNMITVQHTQIRCCTVVSLAACVESTAGIVQVGLQWAMFSFIFVLYMIYFPPHLKLAQSSEIPTPQRGKNLPSRSKLWAHSILLANITIAHFVISAVLTLYLIFASPSPLNSPAPPSPYPDPSFPDPDSSTLPLPLARWALYLGVSSASLAVIQYIPQIAYTWQARLVGALSIPMMCVQSPGAVAMVLSIALRPGTNWTSWITFAVAGLMQFTLLSICIAWKLRQRRLCIDDFGQPLSGNDPSSISATSVPEPQDGISIEEEIVPGLVVGEEENVTAVRKALENALGEAVAGDVREGTEVSETTPLLSEGREASGSTRSAWW
ncbi:hypothetical protein MIND_01253900 [Mycena indigotica]|uniref:PQ loop repeat protein n=1 Tax=Mycena indigotica TaxID=2126181 RepID=A0A8H6VV03_9AGAR|nr:uncharacterized protein MIND_01253900 [Mycena indigotica]KAF7291108.1 hypothetical protein MIND_01253900 [Mycena indigotica]